MNPPVLEDRFGCFVGAPVLAPGRPGLLVVAVKDNIDMQGLPTGAGLGRAVDVAPHDAPLVALLRAAGFPLLGKTRMDEAALSATGDNPHHGRTENPASPGHSPGGSSSGSAAAVAAGLCGAALGTDTLGSVRIPAAYCGLVGLKPTRGVLPDQGITPLSWTLDHPGIMARSVADLATVFAALAGDGEANGPMRIGVPDTVDAVRLDPDIARLFAKALHGWDVLPGRLRGWDATATRLAGLLVAEAEGAVVHHALLTAADPALSPQLTRLLAYGRDCGSGKLVRALNTLRLAARAIDRALLACDLLATPTVPAPAFAWSDGPVPDQADFTAVANFGGHPAITVPIGHTKDGRPAGLQLIGRRGEDWRVIEAARRI